MVYLICMKEKFHHAKHYIGFTQFDNVDNRLEKHRKGTGSRLLRAVNLAGIDYEVVRVWPGGDRNFERKLKNQKNSSRLCPCCNEKMSKHRYIEEKELQNAG